MLCCTAQIVVAYLPDERQEVYGKALQLAKENEKANRAMAWRMKLIQNDLIVDAKKDSTSQAPGENVQQQAQARGQGQGQQQQQQKLVADVGQQRGPTEAQDTSEPTTPAQTSPDASEEEEASDIEVE